MKRAGKMITRRYFIKIKLTFVISSVPMLTSCGSDGTSGAAGNSGGLVPPIDAPIVFPVAPRPVLVMYTSQTETKDLILDPNSGKPSKISFPIVRLTDAGVAEISKNIDQSSRDYTPRTVKLNGQKILGMAGIPALNQGQSGTCATFSSTAAVMAQFKTGNVISQQCQLQFSMGLAGNRIGDWNGANVENVLQRMWDFGASQLRFCRWNYGLNGDRSAPPLSEAQFQATSQGLLKNSVHYRGTWNGNEQNKLWQVKWALDRGARVLVSFFIPEGSMPSVKDPVFRKISLTGDVEGLRKISSSSGKTLAEAACPDRTCAAHAMVAHGYNDAQRVIRFRNSWGTVGSVVATGDYLMTYDYYNSLVYSVWVVGLAGGHGAGIPE